MKDDAVIKDNEAVYLINEQTYLHLRENIASLSAMLSSCIRPEKYRHITLTVSASGNYLVFRISRNDLRC